MSMSYKIPTQTVSPWQPLGRGTHSVVWRTRQYPGAIRGPGDLTADNESNSVDDISNWVVVKVVYDNQSMPPHDIVREAELLKSLSHTNIIPFLGFVKGGAEAPFALYMPLIPLHLTTLLSSPHFSPLPLTGAYSALSRPIFTSHQREEVNPFNTVAQSLIYQLLLAISYLHSMDPPIAHRDINPGNILVDREGTVKLVDFGVAWSPQHVQTVLESQSSHVNEYSRRHPFDGWAETAEHMCCEVATGAHRAPELLFSPLSYSATATDLWSLGTTIAQFFTPLCLAPSYSPLSSPLSTASEDLDDTIPTPFLISPSLRNKIDYRATWERTTLFNGERGELGLAWSIFKLRGTPDDKTWPSFKHLPDVSKIEFHKASRKPLDTVLPHLPPGGSAVDPVDCPPASYPPIEDRSPLSLIDSFLAYSPSSRLSATRAIHHPWFSEPLLPVSHPGPDPANWKTGDGTSSRQSRKWETKWEGQTLEEWLEPVMKREVGRVTRVDSQ